MALLKSVITQYGIDATYWNIFSINEDFKNKTIEIILTGFITKECRDANNDPISYQNITLSDEDYIKDVTRMAVYEKLKLTSFIDAVDD